MTDEQKIKRQERLIVDYKNWMQNAAIDHPAHYTRGGIEAIDAIEAWGLGFNLGNVVKYIARSGHKGDELEDLRKARWYLNRQIAILEAGRCDCHGAGFCDRCCAERALEVRP